MDSYCQILLFFIAVSQLNITNSAGLTRFGGRVLSGTIGQRFAYPYMAEVEIAGLVCSGWIFNPKIVVTASHCFARVLPNQPKSGPIQVEWKKDDAVEVRVGTKLAYNDPITFESRGARKIVIPDNYGIEGNDVAMIILDESLDYNEEVNQLALLENEEELQKAIKEGTECLIIGFGHSGKSDGKLRGDVTYLIPDYKCRQKYCEKGLANNVTIRYSKDSDVECTRDFWGKGETCTLNKKTSACFGDSGSPLVCNGKAYGVTNRAGTVVIREGKKIIRFECKNGEVNVFSNIKNIKRVRELVYENKELLELARYPSYKKRPDAPQRAHPFVVEVVVFSGDDEDSGGQYTGTIISDNLILTSCSSVKLDDGSIVDKSRILVEAGGSEPHLQSSDVKHIITHPDCARKLLKSGKDGVYVYENDVAFLVLKKKLIFGDFVKSKSLLPPSYEKGYVMRFIECQVYGYGYLKSSSPPSVKVRIGSAWLTREDMCRKRFCDVTRRNDELCTRKNYFSTGWVCALNDDTAGCFGHTGGPVVCNGYVIGIDSYLLPCKLRRKKCKEASECQDWPTIFTNSVAIWQVYGIVKNNKTLLAG